MWLEQEFAICGGNFEVGPIEDSDPGVGIAAGKICFSAAAIRALSRESLNCRNLLLQFHIVT
ncbi:MAG: hypothetical protein LBI69_04900 [Puniceicoccales bacterium]|nr:hypothetical protein [Puniceicoccales bacterium]